MPINHPLSDKSSCLSEALYRAIFEQTDRILFLVDPNTDEIVTFNGFAHRKLGYSRKAFSKITLSDMVTPSLTGLGRSLLERLKKGDLALKTGFRTKEGKLLDVQVKATRIRLGEKTLLLFDSHEVALRKLSDKFKRLSTAIFEAVTEAIMVTDANGTILTVNPAFTRITGYSSKQVLGENPRLLQSGRHDKAFYQQMWEAIHTQGHWEGEIWNRRKNGKIYPEWLSVTTVEDEEDHSLKYVGLFSDITRRKVGQAKLELQAYYDFLTRLPNRTLLLERLTQAIKQTRRNNRKAALLFVDLDHFKDVNDTLGHAAGDTVLKQSTERLLACVRETDTVARSGGDEFLIVLTNIKKREEASFVAREILAQFSTPFVFKNKKTLLGASIGIAIIPDNGEDPSALIENADLAMYQSKAAGRNRQHFYDEIMKKPLKNKPKKKRAAGKAPGPSHRKTL